MTRYIQDAVIQQQKKEKTTKEVLDKPLPKPKEYTSAELEIAARTYLKIGGKY